MLWLARTRDVGPTGPAALCPEGLPPRELCGRPFSPRPGRAEAGVIGILGRKARWDGSPNQECSLDGDLQRASSRLHACHRKARGEVPFEVHATSTPEQFDQTSGQTPARTGVCLHALFVGLLEILDVSARLCAWSGLRACSSCLVWVSVAVVPRG